MKKLILIICATTLTVNLHVFPQTRPMQFEKGTWEKFLLKAKKTNKIIFMDAYTKWCGWCKVMDKEVFTNNEVSDFYNASFINVKMDMESEEGVKLNKNFNIDSYPTLLFIDSDGNIVHKASGYLKPKEFIDLGKDALLPEKQIATFNKKYDSGNREPDFIYEYTKVLKKIGDRNLHKVTEEYFNNINKPEILSDKINWSIFLINDATGINSKEFIYVLNNRKLFDSLYTVDSVEKKIASTYKAAALKMIYNYGFDYIEYEVLKSKIRKSGLEKTHQLLLETDMAYFNKTKKWDDYATCAVMLIDIYNEKEKWNDHNFLNNAAWYFYEHINDKILLQKAEQWAKRSVELNSNDYNNDTYAMLLYKLGKKEEALKYEETAIELAKKLNNENTVKEYEDNLKKIKESNR